MKLEQADRQVSHGGHGRTVQAKIKASRKLFSFFSDGVYSNKPVAIARELVANAIDSHVAAGKPNLPVNVILPTELDPTFMVQDFGTGMTEDFIFEKYLVYAEGSTKDGANDAIGGFGIGKAAVFSYVDQFSLVSITDGVKCVYSVFIDEQGIPAITQVAKTTTDEPNGVAISFPVEGGDLQQFHEAAQTALQYFNPLPNVTNGTLNAPDYNYRGKNWMLRDKAGDLAVIMGGIRYPVNIQNLQSALRNNDRLRPLLTYGIDLVMPIGSCGVALSREALSYDGKTSENIAAALEGMIDDVIATFKNMFDDCNSIWDAMVKLYKETQGSSATTGRGKLLAANAFWRGQQITDSIKTHGRVGLARCWLIEPYNSSHYGRRRSAAVGSAKWQEISEHYAVYPGRTEHVIVDDLPMSPKSKTIKKIKIFVEEGKQEGHALVLRAPGDDHTDAKAIAKMLQDLGGPTNVVYTSKLPEPPEIEAEEDDGSGTKVTRVRPRIRMFQSNGRADYHGNKVVNMTPGWAKDHTGAVKEIEYAKQPARGIMVVMNSFDVPGNLHTIMMSGLLQWDELYFINKVDEPKVKGFFTDFEEEFKTRLAAKLALFPELPQRLAVAASAISEYSDWLKLPLGLTPAQKARPFGRMVEVYETYIVPLTAEQRALAPWVKPALPARLQPDKLAEAFKQQQAEALILLQNLDLKTTSHLALIGKHL